MKKTPLLSAMASAMISAGQSIGDSFSGMFNKDNQDSNHFEDLHFRLQSVANKATYKGNRSNIDSTMPIQIEIKREAKKRVLLNEHSERCQFSGEIMADGRHRFYNKNGLWIERQSSI